MNVIEKNRELIELYLIGLKTATKLDFSIGIDLEHSSISFGRNLPVLPKNRKLAIRHIFDSYTLKLENPTLEEFNVCVLFPLRHLIVHVLFQFDDQFYQDRLDGKPFVDERIFDIDDGKGGITTMRCDKIDWLAQLNG